jgi:polysaccharide export outer membrane protein
MTSKISRGMRWAGLLVLLGAACRTADVSPVQTPKEPVYVVPPAPDDSSPPPSSPPPFTLQPGDVIDIRVYQQPSLNLTMQVSDEGRIDFPLVGTVLVAGRIPSSIERELKEKLEKDYLHNAHVSVTVREYRPRKVYALGGVKNPGGYALSPREQLTFLRLISIAGGFSDKASKEHCLIVRTAEKGERRLIRISVSSVEKALARGQADADMELWPDDLLLIPATARVVHVLGAVGTPGSLDMVPDSRMTASMAISRAGGLTKFASSGKIAVLRQQPGGETLRLVVDLDQVVDGKLELDVELRPGDVIWVPERGFF